MNDSQGQDEIVVVAGGARDPGSAVAEGSSQHGATSEAANLDGDEPTRVPTIGRGAVPVGDVIAGRPVRALVVGPVARIGRRALGAEGSGRRRLGRSAARRAEVLGR